MWASGLFHMMTRLLHASILFLMVFFSIPLPPEEISQATQTQLPVIQKLLERCLEIAKTLPNDDEDYDPSIQGYAQDVRSSQARILEDIAITQAMAGNVEAALQTIAAIEDPSWRDPGLLRIVKSKQTQEISLGPKTPPCQRLRISPT